MDISTVQYYKYSHLNVHFIEPLITFRVLVNKMNALQVCNKLFACLFSCNSKISPICLSGMCSVMTGDCESFAYLQWSFFSHFVLLILFDPSNRAIGWALYSFDEKKTTQRCEMQIGYIVCTFSIDMHCVVRYPVHFCAFWFCIRFYISFCCLFFSQFNEFITRQSFWADWVENQPRSCK